MNTLILESKATSATKNNSKSKIVSIQALRAIAAITVTIFHIKDLTKRDPSFNSILDFFFNSGSAGVNLFFVISGFIMVYITQYTPSSLNSIYQFLIKRLIRIWPAYALISVFYAFAVFKFHMHWEINRIVDSLIFLPLSLIDPPFYGYSLLPVGWSLNYEIYFYIIISISLLFSEYKWPVFFLIIFITLIGIPAYSGHFTPDPHHTYNYGNRYINLITNPIIWNFVYGIIIGLLYINIKSFEILSKFFSKFWIVGLIILLAVWQYLSGFLAGLGPFQWGIGSGALFLAFLFYTANKAYKFPQWLIKLGDCSFSIYLLHLPARVVIETIFVKSGYSVYNSGSVIFLLTLSMTIILSSFSHKYLEIRLSNYLTGLFPYFTRNGRIVS